MNKTWREIIEDWEYDQINKIPDRLQTIYYMIRRNVKSCYWSIRTWPKRFYQRRTRGFDYTEMWSLDYSIAKLVAPRLRHFRDNYASAPTEFYDLDPKDPSGIDTSDASYERAHQRWLEVLDKMLYSFENMVRNEGWDLSLDKIDYKDIYNGNPNYEVWSKANNEHYERMQEGFLLFGLFIGALWD